jgi:hypothetical protein
MENVHKILDIFFNFSSLLRAQKNKSKLMRSPLSLS